MFNFLRRSSLGKKDGTARSSLKPEKITVEFQGSELGLRLQLQEEGVVVCDIARPSEALDLGLRVGDIVHEINGKEAVGWTVEQVVKACSGSKPLKFSVLRPVAVPGSSGLPIAIAANTDAQFETGKVAVPLPIAVETNTSPGFPAIGCQFDCLHKFPLNEEIRCAPAVPPNRVPPEPKTGWRWRPCVIQAVEDVPRSNGEARSNRYAQVKFLDALPGYPQEASVDLGDNNEFIAPLGLKSPNHVMHHSYRSDDILDVLDIFPSKFDQSIRKKWRKCQIVAVSPYFIRVTFCGWSEAYDIWIHVLEEVDRLAEFGLYTERQQVEETNRERDFRKKMLAKGLQVVDVSPDGNCLFRSVSLLLYGDESRHGEIRKACCDYMEKDRKRFEFLAEDGDFAAYIRNMRNPGEWGDEPELRVIEELYDRPISMYSCDIVGQNDNVDFTEPMAHYRVGEEVAGLQDAEPLRLSFHGNNHYNAVVRTNVPNVYNPNPTENQQRIRRHRLMQGAGSSLATVRSHNSFSLRRSNSTVSNIGK